MRPVTVFDPGESERDPGRREAECSACIWAGLSPGGSSSGHTVAFESVQLRTGLLQKGMK